jgi:hypothetical protein
LLPGAPSIDFSTSSGVDPDVDICGFPFHGDEVGRGRAARLLIWAKKLIFRAAELSEADSSGLTRSSLDELSSVKGDVAEKRAPSPWRSATPAGDQTVVHSPAESETALSEQPRAGRTCVVGEN